MCRELEPTRFTRVVVGVKRLLERYQVTTKNIAVLTTVFAVGSLHILQVFISINLSISVTAFIYDLFLYNKHCKGLLRYYNGIAVFVGVLF